MRLERISDIYWEVRNGVRGFLYWLPFSIKWRSWDYEWGLRALQHHLKALEKDVREGYHADAEKTSREIRVAIKLIENLSTQKYLLRNPQREEIAWSYLFHLMKRKMRSWWE